MLRLQRHLLKQTGGDRVMVQEFGASRPEPLQRADGVCAPNRQPPELSNLHQPRGGWRRDCAPSHAVSTVIKPHGGAARFAGCYPEKLTQTTKRGGNRRTRMMFLHIRGGSILDAKSGSVSGANQHPRHHRLRFPKWDFVLLGYGRFSPRNMLGTEIIFPLGGNIVEHDSAVMRRSPKR